ncbi:hypothetical protein BJX62DRAFT_235329 [Aspergillus germanicus]
MASSSLSRQTGVQPTSYSVTLSRYPENPQSFTSTPVVSSPSGDEFHSPGFKPSAMLLFSMEDFPSMSPIPPNPNPPRSRSVEAGSGEGGSTESGGGKSKKRQEQNRNAQRLYRQRKQQYVQGLLSHIDEINKRHMSLQSSYKALHHKTAGLQGQVEVLKEQLEFWSRVEVVLLRTPEGDQPIAGGASGATTGAGASVNLGSGMGVGGEMGFLGDSMYPLYPNLSCHSLRP